MSAPGTQITRAKPRRADASRRWHRRAALSPGLSVALWDLVELATSASPPRNTIFCYAENLAFAMQAVVCSI